MAAKNQDGRRIFARRRRAKIIDRAKTKRFTRIRCIARVWETTYWESDKPSLVAEKIQDGRQNPRWPPKRRVPSRLSKKLALTFLDQSARNLAHLVVSRVSPGLLFSFL